VRIAGLADGQLSLQTYWECGKGLPDGIDPAQAITRIMFRRSLAVRRSIFSLKASEHLITHVIHNRAAPSISLSSVCSSAF
jgi:hypothetical protein